MKKTRPFLILSPDDIQKFSIFLGAWRTSAGSREHKFPLVEDIDSEEARCTDCQQLWTLTKHDLREPQEPLPLPNEPTLTLVRKSISEKYLSLSPNTNHCWIRQGQVVLLSLVPKNELLPQRSDLRRCEIILEKIYAEDGAKKIPLTEPWLLPALVVSSNDFNYSPEQCKKDPTHRFPLATFVPLVDATCFKDDDAILLQPPAGLGLSRQLTPLTACLLTLDTQATRYGLPTVQHLETSSPSPTALRPWVHWKVADRALSAVLDEILQLLGCK